MLVWRERFFKESVTIIICAEYDPYATNPKESESKIMKGIENSIA